MPGYVVLTCANCSKTGLVCPECNLILKDAVQTPEGIRLCESCYKEIVKESMCTSKKTGITVAGEDGMPSCFPDKAVRREISQLEVQCTYREVGCNWVGQLKNYFEKHHDTCGAVPVVCKVCNGNISRQEMGQHMQTQHGQVSDETLNQSKDDPTPTASYFTTLLRQLGLTNQRQVSQNDGLGLQTPPANSHEPLQQSMEDDLQRSREKYPFLSGCFDTLFTYGNKFLARLRHVEKKQSQQKAEIEAQLKDVERQVKSEMELQLASTYNGFFMWRIPDLKKRKRDAIDGRMTSLYSPPFYTAKNGYKMCIRVYLNGDGMGHKTHLSLFFVLMKGEFDALLKWPFDYKVSLILVDQNHRKHIVQTFKPTPESSSFQRPISDMNVASGCPQFCKLSYLDDDNYTKDDVLFVKCIVDTSRIFHP